MLAPHVIVPTGRGGLSLEFRRGHCSLSLEFDADGAMELLVLSDGHFVQRTMLNRLPHFDRLPVTKELRS